MIIDHIGKVTWQITEHRLTNCKSENFIGQSQTNFKDK